MPDAPTVAIVDYGMGNLFSVARVCEHVDLRANVTTSVEDLYRADAVILPGVGSFGHAMSELRRLGMVDALRDIAASGRPLAGVCLGMQLLMSESAEFGSHEGLGIIEGDVVPFDAPAADGHRLKVPQVGWNHIEKPRPDAWAETYLEEVDDGAFMYFVHSLYVRPADDSVVLATTPYGQYRFCSVLQQGNVFGCQFHPERSGMEGVRIYRSLARALAGRAEAQR